MLPEGNYTARATDWGLSKTGTGKEQIEVIFEVTAGEHATQRVRWRGFFTEKTFERTIESLRFCGWRGVDLANVDNLNESEVQIVVEHEEGQTDGQPNGKKYPRVQWVNRLSSVGLKEQLAPQEAQTFAQRMKSQILAFDAKNRAPGGSTGHGAKPAASRPAGSRGGPPEPPPFTDDDIPF
jgi:hypothetical protein